MGRGNSTTFIDSLDDDSLLNIFCVSRPVLLDEDDDDDDRILDGGEWGRERWWYNLPHVCRRWRYLIFGSASYLGLSLVCTDNTPVANMLEHSPPLPLVIDHIDNDYISAKDEEGIILALQHRDRVRRIRLRMSVPNLQKLLVALNDKFPMLEYLIISPPHKHIEGLTLPRTFQAPRLRHIMLVNFDFPIRSPLLTPAVGLVTLSLQFIHPSAYFHPNDLLQQLALMPQLETLGIDFHSPVLDRDVEMQLFNTPMTTHVALPNLRWFGFGGASAYLEVLLPRVTTPLLQKLQIVYPDQPTFFVPCLLQFMITAKTLRFISAKFCFYDNKFLVRVYPREGASIYAFDMEVLCRYLDLQVSSMAQISNTLSPVFSAVTHLTLLDEGHNLLSEGRSEVDRTEWHRLLRSFSNVKTLLVDNELVGELARCLQSDHGELPHELLLELKELIVLAGCATGDAFQPFIDARQIAGHPVNLVRC